MKSILKLAACALLVDIIIFVSCKKDAVPNNHIPPTANAGPDKTVTLASCSSSSFIDLDGGSSTDPDNNINSYLWTKISGPSAASLSNYTAAIARLGNLLPGQYSVELKVTDAEGLSSKDTVLVNVTGPGGEYDLDVTINTNYTFYDNYEDCYYGPPCWYYDWITIQGSSNFPPTGQLNFYTSEYGDTATLGTSQGVNMNLYDGNGNTSAVWGTCSVSFKHLIEQGGGSFNGTLKADGGSAQACNQLIYENLPPLTVTGSLDTSTHTISIKIKGKIYF
ncbi:MAG TPA: hypothetical protein VGQ53_08825 [Chitinophagaceae bacterium]|jgi:K319-like protein|nr:hypothetical protein [Chitinophagaceae bacterium]